MARGLRRRSTGWFSPLEYCMIPASLSEFSGISRFDNYIGTTNTNATVIVAFNTFIFSAIVLKWNDL